jgi:hypothetical protein
MTAIERNDKMNAAAHEAAHLTIAMAEGRLQPRAYIARTALVDENGVTSEYGVWGGECSFVESEPSPALSVAGYLGEWWIAQGDLDASAAYRCILIDGGVECQLSKTDAAGVGGQKNLWPAIRRAASLLRKHEAFFRWAMDELVENEVVTDGQAAEQFTAATAA